MPLGDTAFGAHWSKLGLGYTPIPQGIYTGTPSPVEQWADIGLSITQRAHIHTARTTMLKSCPLQSSRWCTGPRDQGCISICLFASEICAEIKKNQSRPPPRWGLFSWRAISNTISKSDSSAYALELLMTIQVTV